MWLVGGSLWPQRTNCFRSYPRSHEFVCPIQVQCIKPSQGRRWTFVSRPQPGEYNITGDTYGVILTPLILSRLPPDVRLEWARNGAGHESDLEFLLSFLKLEIQCRERSQTFRELRSPVVAEEKRKPHAATAAALQTRSESVNNQCNICHKGHPTEKCWNLTQVSLDERQEKMSKAGLCFRCLNKGHISKNCNKKCARCHGRHSVVV